MLAESAHGTFRMLVLEPHFGPVTSRQISFLPALILIYGITDLLIRWINAPHRTALLHIGLFWVAITLVFEFALGRALGRSWYELSSDYDPTRGGLMVLGAGLMGLAPLLTARWGKRRAGSPQKKKAA
jgi:hypothetical protein